MKIEKAVAAGIGVQFWLTLSSAGVESHSVMSDNPKLFDEMLDFMQEAGKAFLQAHRDELKLKPENSPEPRG